MELTCDCFLIYLGGLIPRQEVVRSWNERLRCDAGHGERRYFPIHLVYRVLLSYSAGHGERLWHVDYR